MPAPPRGGPRAAALLTLLAAAALAPAGCGTKPASTVVVVLASEAAIGTEVDNIDISSHHDGQDSIYPSTIDATLRLPGTITVADNPNDDVKASEPAEVTFKLFSTLEGRPPLSMERTISSAMLEDDPRMLFVTLRYACANFDVNKCQIGETCVAGRCRSTSVDAASLPKFDKTKIFPRAGVDPCFDTAQGFADPIDLAPSALVPGGKEECFLEPPSAPGASGASRKLNVALSWDRDPTRAITLDNEPSAFEGWAFVDDATHKIRLAPGYCDLAKPAASKSDLRPRLTNVRISYAAAPKTQLLPLCDPPGPRMGFTIPPKG